MVVRGRLTGYFRAFLPLDRSQGGMCIWVVLGMGLGVLQERLGPCCRTIRRHRPASAVTVAVHLWAGSNMGHGESSLVKSLTACL